MKRIFFSVDAHGSTTVWRKWLKVQARHDIDVMLLCGDLTGKALVPIIAQRDGSYRAYYFGRDWELETEREVREMERRLTSAGIYHMRCTMAEVEELQRNPAKVNELILCKMKERLTEWLDCLLEEVDTQQVSVIVMPGNDDDFEIDPIIKSYEEAGIIYPLGRVVEIAGFEMISLDYVNPTPWDTPREASEREMKRKIEALVGQLRDPSRAIFNFHCPPYGTRLDLAPKLDRSLRPEVVAGTVIYDHVGSRAVREAIERYQPLIGLHGHIHESYGAERLGKTPIINPGSEYGEGILRGFIIEVSERGVEDYLKVEG
ncbi:TPA: phosphoesterase [Candidatus Poribacteria bacterium]|nr:phosphoesterase [Candidatus Poribacteria bacterium]